MKLFKLICICCFLGTFLVQAAISAVRINLDLIKGLGHMIELGKAQKNIQKHNYDLQSKLHDMKRTQNSHIAEEFGMVKNKDHNVIVKYE